MEPQGAPNAPRRPLKPLQARSAKTQYLILYNFVSTLLWLIILGRVVALNALTRHVQVFASTGEFVKWTQTLAGLEVVHAGLGTCGPCM
jgi:very-long-chain (3R)-3-hydroxyacyl-CoA dehydratase